jgi:predicted Zn-dependent protease
MSKYDGARDTLAALGQAPCGFRPPLDELGQDYLRALLAVAQGAEPPPATARPRNAAARGVLEALASAATEGRLVHDLVTGPTSGLTLLRRRSARMVEPSMRLRVGLAIADAREGKLEPAISALRELAREMPEAEANLGLLFEQQGKLKQAYDALMRARRRGAAVPAPWTEAKERLFQLGAAP